MDITAITKNHFPKKRIVQVRTWLYNPSKELHWIHIHIYIAEWHNIYRCRDSPDEFSVAPVIMKDADCSLVDNLIAKKRTLPTFRPDAPVLLSPALLISTWTLHVRVVEFPFSIRQSSTARLLVSLILQRSTHSLMPIYAMPPMLMALFLVKTSPFSSKHTPVVLPSN